MIEVRNCSLSYRAPQGPVAALQEISFAVAEHEFVALLGPSGCGKTSLIKLVAGLMPPSDGQITVQGVPVTRPGSDRAVVFQDFALMPWATVRQNIAFGLEMRGMARREREQRADELAQTVGLAGFEHSYPRQLSGGMQQRVGLARALAIEPRILLLDEPFGALDAQTRRLLQDDLIGLHRQKPKTVLFVTHDIDEALRLADRVVMLTPRPGTVAEIVEVPFDRSDPEAVERAATFAELKAYLWQRLQEMQNAMGMAKGRGER